MYESSQEEEPKKDQKEESEGSEEEEDEVEPVAIGETMFADHHIPTLESKKEQEGG